MKSEKKITKKEIEKKKAERAKKVKTGEKVNK